MREEYDLAIGMGDACACSKNLRKANMQPASFPFDWLNGAALRGRIALAFPSAGDGIGA